MGNKLAIAMLCFLGGLYCKVEVSNSIVRMTDMISAANIRFTDVVYAQMVLETGYFTSAIYKENNNMTGMKCAEKRQTHCIGTNRGHAVYKSKLYCLLDYEEWQRKFVPETVRTSEQYIDFLMSYGYAEDKFYAAKIKSILKLINTDYNVE